ncbi:hypothetical protein GC176_09120 [bacterium]|nr:hypothetical protein [bacterium]
MLKPFRKRTTHQRFCVSVARCLAITLAGCSVFSGVSQSLGADDGQSLRSAALRAFDRNHNCQLDGMERRSMRVRLRSMFAGQAVSSDTIRNLTPELQAVYVAADRNRSGALSSAESRAAAALLSSSEPATGRTTLRSQQMRTIPATTALSAFPSSASRLSAAPVTASAGSGQAGPPATRFGSGRYQLQTAGSQIHPAATTLGQVDFRAAQMAFERMRAQMEREAQLRSRGIEVPSGMQTRNLNANIFQSNPSMPQPGGQPTASTTTSSTTTRSVADDGNGQPEETGETPHTEGSGETGSDDHGGAQSTGTQTGTSTGSTGTTGMTTDPDHTVGTGTGSGGQTGGHEGHEGHHGGSDGDGDD